MASVVKELFGAFPKFLEIKKNPRLLDMLVLRNNLGVGARILKTEWRGFKDCYYTVSRVEYDGCPKRGKVFGYLTWKGVQHKKEVKINSSSFSSYKFYKSPEETKELEEKLNLR